MSGKIANVAVYDDWGHANRVPVFALKAPSAFTTTNTMVADVALPAGNSNQSVSGRVLYNFVDMPLRKAVCVNGGSCVSGGQQSRVWSSWAATPSLMEIRLSSGFAVCGFPCTKKGVQTEAVEFRRYETGVTPMWTTMRFPGQQYDEETDFFSNNHRFYDPSRGSYLQPEPMLQSPDYVLIRAMAGRSVPAYGYADNNPIRYTDTTGLATIRLCTFGVAGIDANLSRKGNTTFDFGAELTCGGASGAELSISVTNECTTMLKGGPGSAVFGLGSRPTTYDDVVKHENGHVDDMNSCLSSWVARNASAEGDYCTRDACDAKRQQLWASWAAELDQCQINSERKWGDRR